MVRRLFLVGCMMGMSWIGMSPLCSAQIGGGGIKTTAADDIRNTSATSGKVNAWISRNGPSAVVLKIENPVAGATTIPGKLTQYVPATTGIDDYILQPTTLTLSTGSVTSDRVDVDLQLIGDNRGYKTFSILARGRASEGPIGWLSFRSGNGDRSRSRVLVRMKRDKIKDAAAPTTSSTNPCDAPPTDDVGEEELFDVDPDATSQPSKVLPKVPASASTAN
ncbi:MAG: hypothetical protein ACK5OB_05145 [Pirellula sp.]